MVITKNTEMICENIKRRPDGELCFADIPLSTLAEKYGTPLYLYDEARIRHNCRMYLDAVRKGFGPDASPAFPTK